MVVSVKDAFKLAGISVVACCAVFVCTLFLNYQIDLTAMEQEITGEAAQAMYRAQVSMGKATCAVTGGCLALTSVILLLFYIKNYIDAHGKQLGILKALGYSELGVAKHFWVFGCSVFAGCAVGFAAAFAYLPHFYRQQNAEGLFPDIAVRFHPILPVCLILLPTLAFMAVSVLYAWSSLRRPVLSLLREAAERPRKPGPRDAGDLPFLQSMARSQRRGRKTVTFLVGFSAFCFSAMVQMSCSMLELASETFAWMILMIGLILAFVTLVLSLTSAVKAQAKTVALMRAMGYRFSDCCRVTLGSYRPAAYIGFVLGTGYQYALLKIMINAFFGDIGSVPEYLFDVKALFLALAAFLLCYELMMRYFAGKIRKISVKSLMLE